MERKGFVDLQVNGYLGVDLVSPGLTSDDLHRMTAELLSRGTVGYCATVITSDMEIYRRNLPLIAKTMDESGVRRRLLGIHMEGPYLSTKEGARGAHSANVMRLPDPDEFDRFQEWAQGKIEILTLAPELPGAIRLIEHIASHHRTKVSVGHHLAPREVIHQAADAGATLITHLGNGCPNMVPRHESIIIYQMVEDRLHAGLIGDGHHLPDDFIRVALRCKGIDNVFIVSDSAPIAGFPAGEYETLGNRVTLTPAGRIQHATAMHLVGSGNNLAECMRHLVGRKLLTEDEAWRAGLVNPMAILGIPVETVATPDLADFPF
jgi:N-acetylglucosamine-6-phosphate deacetylase